MLYFVEFTYTCEFSLTETHSVRVRCLADNYCKLHSSRAGGTSAKWGPHHPRPEIGERFRLKDQSADFKR